MLSFIPKTQKRGKIKMDNELLFEVEGSFNNMRLDSFIAEKCENVSRSHAVKLIEDGCVLVDGNESNKKYKLSCGERVKINFPEAKELDVCEEEIELDIIYEDEYMLVINKRQGMVVHPAAGNYSGTLVNALMHHCKGQLSGINGVMRPGIVHRIDKDTSGLIVVAKNDEAHIFLSEQLKDRSLSRIYYALVNGNIKQDEGIINQPIGRNEKDRKKMCVTHKNSREAITRFEVIERFGKYTLVRCHLSTGRTHQIRVHLSYIGHSVVGDKTYGQKKDEFKLNGQLLHAKKIKFIHPKTKTQMEFEAPLPDYFENVLRKLRNV